MLNLNSKEQITLDVISKVSSGKLGIKQAQQILNKSESTIFRYLRFYDQKGALFVKHGNCFKVPKNKTPLELETRIIELCKQKYFDFNRSHARELIAENEGIIIAKDTFNRICSRHKILNKNIKKRKKNKSRYRRERMAQKGLMLQLDGSPHKWFGREKTCLVAIIDDADSDLLHAEFSKTETTFACMNVVKQVLKSYGVFNLLYTDKAGIFGRDPLNYAYAVKREGFSSLKSCLAKFGTHIIHAHSPEAKGRIERAFKTLQDRLIPEMRLAGVTSIDEANKYLKEVYLPKHRSNFKIEAQKEESAFSPLLSSVNLDEYFYKEETRIIKNDHTISYESKTIDIDPLGENFAGKELSIRTYPHNNQVRYFVGDKEVKQRDEEFLKQFRMTRLRCQNR